MSFDSLHLYVHMSHIEHCAKWLQHSWARDRQLTLRNSMIFNQPLQIKWQISELKEAVTPFLHIVSDATLINNFVLAVGF